MATVLITSNPGSGKTTVAIELTLLGHAAIAMRDMLDQVFLLSIDVAAQIARLKSAGDREQRWIDALGLA